MLAGVVVGGGDGDGYKLVLCETLVDGVACHQGVDGVVVGFML